MLPDELPPREPLENPPPPPRAFAKEIVGTATNVSTRHAAMSLVVFKLDILSLNDRVIPTTASSYQACRGNTNRAFRVPATA